MSRSRRLVAGLLVVGAALLGTACTVPEDEPGAAPDTPALQQKTIGVSFPKYSVQAGPTLEIEIAKQEAEKQGYTLLVDDPGQDQNKQIGVVETWIQQGVGTIVIQPNAPEVFEDIARRARAKGIKWIVYANKMDNQDATLGFDHIQGGALIAKQAADFINEELDGEAKVAILTYQAGPWARTRQQGIEDELLKQAPGAKIVARQDALSVTDGAQVMGPILQAHPDINVVLAIEEDAAEGAYQTAVDNGKPKNDPKMFFAGIDGTVGVFKYLKAGDTSYRASAALDLAAVGRGFVELPKRLWAGQSGDYTVPFELVTSETPELADKYLKLYGEG